MDVCQRKIRYLDNNRDMAEELFDGRVASDMTLGEAIVRGILPTPNYVTTVYQYQKDLARYQTRVDNLRSPGIQDVNQKYLDALRRALEQADGLDKVFAFPLRLLCQLQPVTGVRFKVRKRLVRIRVIGVGFVDRHFRIHLCKPLRHMGQEPKRKSENLNVSADHKTGEGIGWCSRSFDPE